METLDRPAVAGPPRRTFAAGLGRVGRLVRKELYESLRDRRTIITLVLMPLLLYPMLSMAFMQFLYASGVAERQVKDYRIGFSTKEEVVLVATCLNAANQNKNDDLPGWDIYPNLDRAVRQGKVDLGVRVLNWKDYQYDGQKRPILDAAQKSHPLVCELIYVEGSPQSRQVLDYFEQTLARANGGYLEARVPLGQGAGELRVHLSRLAQEPPEDRKGAFLYSLIPLILILMTITGAVYPAIDLTAGERERGTLEILVAAPVPRLALLFAKYVSVVTVAMLTALANLVMMTVTLQVSGLGTAVFEGGGLTPLLILQMFGLLLLFAAFFSAVLLMVSSFARSFKEAQAYLVPLMLLSLAPGLIGMLPGLELSGLLTVVPLLNIVLLSRDLLLQGANPVMAVVVVLSTLLYALAALAGAARFFGAEAVLYSEQTGWSDLFRRPAEPRDAASLSGGLLCLALIFPMYFILISLLASPALTRGAQFFLQVPATLFLFVVFPLLSALQGRVRLAPGFQALPAPPLTYLGAILLGLALFPFIYELLVLLRSLGLTLLTEAQARANVELVRAWSAYPLWLIAGTLALVGVFEELFFRGYLFTALKSSNDARTTIVASAVLFGLFHFATAFDRLLPSTLLGLVLGWVAWNSRSVVPALLLHASYNAMIVLLADLKRRLGDASDHLPVEWLGGAAVALAAGAVLVHIGRARIASRDNL
jgi:ABC-2 type transport system permease protein/sodium transport system permease protein